MTLLGYLLFLGWPVLLFGLACLLEAIARALGARY